MTATAASAVSSDVGEVKACCSDLWSHPAVQLLAGDAFRPGGLKMTTALLDGHQHAVGGMALDIGSGLGTTLGCLVDKGYRPIGLDYSASLATQAAKQAPVVRADGEGLPFAPSSFDVVLAECVISVLPDKTRSLADVRRVVRDDGMFVMSDVSVAGILPPELDNILGWAACAAGALSDDGWRALVGEGGFTLVEVADRKPELQDLVAQARRRLAMIQGAVGTGIVDTGIDLFSLPGIDQVMPGVDSLPLGDALTLGQDLLGGVAEAVDEGQLGYVSLVARPD